MPPNNFSRISVNPLYTATHPLSPPTTYNTTVYNPVYGATYPSSTRSNTRSAFSPLHSNNLRRQNSRRNVGPGLKQPVKTKKGVVFSNGSRPGNNINKSLPKSKVSQTSNKTPGAYVVPPTSVGNSYKANKQPGFFNSLFNKSQPVDAPKVKESNLSQEFNQNKDLDPNNDEGDFLAGAENGESSELKNMREAGLKTPLPPKKNSWWGGRRKSRKSRKSCKSCKSRKSRKSRKTRKHRKSN